MAPYSLCGVQYHDRPTKLAMQDEPRQPQTTTQHRYITDGQGTNGVCLLAVAFSCRLGIAPPPYSLAASLCDCNFGLITPDRSDALKSGVTPSNLEEVDATSLFSQKQTFVSARGTSA